MLGAVSCNSLDLNPLSSGSSENWFSTETEVRMSLDDLYRDVFWPIDPVRLTDDHMAREVLGENQNGTFNGQTSFVCDLWSNQYKVIARSNTILEKLNENEAILNLTQEKLDALKGEARFMRAAKYANLISHFGDVVYVDRTLDIETAFALGRTSKSEIIPKVYEDFEYAAKTLPIKRTDFNRVTSGAALALKARFALYNEDWDIAIDAAKRCIDLDIYSLHKDYASLFLTSTRTSPEFIFTITRSVENGVTWSPGKDKHVQGLLPRNVGGFGGEYPSWSLFASYLCTDGLPIDESPIFDPHDPFKNRDPRCAATMVEFGTEFLGVEYQPHPDALKVMNYSTGKMITNNDNRAVNVYASYNGLLLKKGVDLTWKQNGYKIDPENIVIRYADLLLIYAEAKIENNDIDQSVLDAINAVRARAYGVDKSMVGSYPAVQTTNQQELRKIIRFERRMEFAFEGGRYMDLIRWKIANKAFSYKNYGLNYPAEKIDREKWFWGMVPEIDNNAIADFTKLEEAGLIMSITVPNWDDRQYLWPIPTKEIQINPNIKQNPGY